MGLAAVLGQGQDPAGLHHQSPHRDGGHQASISVGLQEAPLLAAGLWEDTSPLLPDGNLGTFTIITGDSSGVSANIHDRMPVWLQAGQIDEWMAASPDDAMAMLLASEPPAMEAYRVSRAVNTPRNNSEDLLLPFARTAQP